MGGPWRLLARLLLTPPLLVLCVLKVESGEPAEPASTEAEQTVMPTVPRASVHKCVKWGEYVDQGPNSKPLYTYPLKWDATSRNCDVVMASDQKVRDRYRQWEWTIPKHVAAECPTSSTQPFKIIRKRYCSALANRSILFLGDSTQRDMFKSAVLLAIAAVNEPEILDALDEATAGLDHLDNTLNPYDPEQRPSHEKPVSSHQNRNRSILPPLVPQTFRTTFGVLMVLF